MAFRQTGVRASVQGFARFMSEIRRMTDAIDKSSRDTVKAIQKEELARERLTLAMSDQREELDKLIAKHGEASREAHEAEISLRGLELRYDDITDSIMQLNKEAGKGGGAGGILGQLLGGLGGGGLGGLGGLAAIFAMPGIAKGINQALGLSWGQIFKALAAPIRLAVNAVKLLIGVLGKLVNVALKVAGVIMKVVGFFWNLAKTIAGIVVGAVKALLSVVSSLVSALFSAIGTVFNFAGSLAGIAGKSVAWAAETAMAALQAFMRVLSPVIQEAWAGAEAFQRLSIRFQGLVANEMKAKDETLDFGLAMEQAEAPSQRLLRWMQQLAVTTPFSRKDISETMAFSMAMGFTADQAQELTLAIGDFVSGMGLESDVMERIILQFGQMQAGGRLYGTELRDLARGAFVPVNDILEKVAATLDMTAKEWQDLAARGETDIQPFFDEFIRMASERFPNAMHRMNNTLTAVKQNFHDFVTEFLGVKMLGPALESLSGWLNKMLSQLLSPNVMNAFAALGKHLENLADLATHAADVFLNALIPSTRATGGTISMLSRRVGRSIDEMQGLQKLLVYVAAGISLIVDEIAKAFDKTDEEIGNFATDVRNWAVEAFKWGFNIVNQLAMGIVRGTATVLIAAMNFIGNMLTYWLRGMSPPRIAPDLPEWGAAALQEWLHGMTEADFGILEAIQSPLRQALSVMEAMGVITQNEIGPLWAEFSTALAEGFAGGGLSTELLDSIRESFDEFGEEIVLLVQAQYDLAEATKAVEEAEAALEDARKRHSQATADVAREITEYNRMLREGATQAELRAQMERINEAKDRQEIAEDDIVAAEDQLDLAQEQEKEARKQADIQQNILNQMLDIAAAMYDITEETGRAGGAAGALEDLFEDMDEELTSIGGAAAGAGANISRAFQEARDDIKKAWGTLMGDIAAQWEDEVGPSLDTLKTKFNDFKNDVIIPLMMALGGGELEYMDVGDAPRNVRERHNEQVRRAEGLRQAFDSLGQTIDKWFGEGGNLPTFIEHMRELGEVVLPEIPGMVVDLAEALGLKPEGLGGTIKGIFPTWDEFLGRVKAFFDEGGTWDQWMQTLDEVIVQLLGEDKSFGDEIEYITDNILPDFEELLESVGGLLDTIKNILGIGEEGGEGVNSGLGKFLETLDSIILIADRVVGFFQGVASALERIVTSVQALAAVDWEAFWWYLTHMGNPLGDDIEPPLQHGAWYIPRDNYRARLHRGEMVLPPHVAEMVRAAMESSPRGGFREIVDAIRHYTSGGRPHHWAPPLTVAGPVIPQNTVNFHGGINVYDRMDWMAAKAQAERMVRGMVG